MAISIKFIADLANWLSGLSDSEEALDDNAAGLEDLMKQAVELGTQAGRTADQIAEDFSKAFGVPVDRAKRAVDEVIGKTEDLSAAGDDAGDALGTGISDGASKAGDSMSELGSIAKDVLAGDFSSASDTAASALALLGPAGVVAGGLAAGGIALITAAFGKAEEQRAALQARANDLANAYIEAGSNVLDAITIASRTTGILTNPEQRKQAEELAKVLGVDLPTAARALAGDANALAIANKLAADAERENAELGEDQLARSSKRKSATSDQILANERLVDSVRDLNTVAGGANDTFEAQQGVLRGLIRDAGTATEEVDNLGNKLYTLPDGTKIVVDAETGQATTDLATFKGDLDDSVPTVRTTTIKFVPDTTAWDAARRRIQSQVNAGINVVVRPGQVVYQ